MMRRIDDYTTGESIAYTGRGDTESKAMEQLNFIFQNELAKNPAAQKGLTKTEDGYELTFMLNNLMSSNLFLGMGTSGLAGLDERDSMLREKAIFDVLSQGLTKMGNSTLLQSNPYTSIRVSTLWLPYLELHGSKPKSIMKPMLCSFH